MQIEIGRLEAEMFRDFGVKNYPPTTLQTPPDDSLPPAEFIEATVTFQLKRQESLDELWLACEVPDSHPDVEEAVHANRRMIERFLSTYERHNGYPYAFTPEQRDYIRRIVALRGQQLLAETCDHCREFLQVSRAWWEARSPPQPTMTPADPIGWRRCAGGSSTTRSGGWSMPFRCACGTEFDPWEHESCPRCGEDLHIDAARQPVRLVCRNGHVAYRDSVAAGGCPVCKEPLLAPAATEAPYPAEGPHAPPETSRSAERRLAVLMAEYRIRALAYVVGLRGVVALCLGWMLAIDDALGLGTWGPPFTNIRPRRDQLPAGLLLVGTALFLLWEARQILRRRPPTRWALVPLFGFLATHEAMVVVRPGRWGVELPFPWIFLRANPSLPVEFSWGLGFGIFCLALADALTARTLMGHAYDLTFYFGFTQSRPATLREVLGAPGASLARGFSGLLLLAVLGVLLVFVALLV